MSASRADVVVVGAGLAGLRCAGLLTEAGLEQEQAARSLGANAVQRLRRITLPTIKWALGYGVVLSVARCLGEFGATTAFAGSLQGTTRTLPLLVYLQRETYVDGAVALSLLLVAVAVVVIAVGRSRTAEGLS